MDKEQQKKLLIKIMELDERDGLYEQPKQQTAVEWLVNELLFIQSLKEDEITESNKGILTTSTIEQAKQMEKEQMLGFHKWMKENDTADNAEKYFHYSDEDMLNEYYKK